MADYYNEIDPYRAQWIRNLIAARQLPWGEVDDRDIRDVSTADLRGFRRCHFFAGVGGWALALRLAGWPDDEPAWTGSCPCQRFSSASRGRPAADDLWEPFFGLIRGARPRRVFGEQVDEAGEWLDGVVADLESVGYAVDACVLPAYLVGLDHARERIYFAGYADGEGEPSGALHAAHVAGLPRGRRQSGGLVSSHGLSARVAQLRAFGDAVVPDLAAAFIRSVRECQP